MKKIVTNAYIFNDMRDCRRMFAEVVEDTRYETGHHIVRRQVRIWPECFCLCEI